MEISSVKNALLTVKEAYNIPVYRFTKTSSKPQELCIVWGESGTGSDLHGDSIKVCQTITGYIKHFTKTEDDPVCDFIQRALNNAEIGFRLDSVEYDPETRIITHEWAWMITKEI